MPRAGSTPQPEFASTGTYGEAAASNALQDAVPSFLSELPILDDDEEQFAPSNDDEAFLAAPSDFPEMPLTAGVPFGPGPDIVARPYETERDFLGRVASSLETLTLPGAKDFARRIREGR